jgi:hypothetical protein
MKRFHTSIYLYVLILFSITSNGLVAQLIKSPVKLNGGVPNAGQLLNNGSQGKEFVFCLPLNDNGIQPARAKEIYVASSKKTRIYYEYNGTRQAFQLLPLKVLVLKEPNITLPEAEESEASQPAIRITSDDPVSVYVYNGKDVTADGFLAIPTQSWGTSYISLSWPDYNEARPWKGGFAIVSSQEQTEVTITLRSPDYGEFRVPGNAKTEGGKRYGASWKITLGKDECYLVQGDGTTQFTFDLSGSQITSNKPVGFICYHQRAVIPQFSGFGSRDYMVEMVPPTNQWGKTYVSVEYRRRGELGDIFRAVALEDNTRITYTQYDFKTRQRIAGPTPIKILRKGEAVSLPALISVTSPGSAVGVRGMSVWTSSKPFMLMQYACSSTWDGDDNYDPYMIYIVSKEQFTKATLYQAPTNPSYTEHFFNLIADTDPNDSTKSGLKSIKIDGVSVASLEPSFLGNRIPGTNMYYARIKSTNGVHFIQGDVPFGGYIYGFGAFDSYGWPAATAFKDLSKFDTIPPALEFTENCGTWEYTAKDNRPLFKVNDTLNHEDTGVNDISYLDNPEMVNFDPIELLKSDGVDVVSTTELPNDRTNGIVTFRIKVTDLKKDAFAKFRVADRALNVSFDSVRWFAPKFELNPDPIRFGNVRVGRTKTMIATLTNTTERAVTLKRLSMKLGQYYSLDDATKAKIAGGVTLQPKEQMDIGIVYSPQIELVDPAERDKDSLILEETCVRFAYYVEGRGVLPHIAVSDWDAGNHAVNSGPHCISGTGLFVRLRNTGTDTLTVFGIDRTVIQPPFTYTPVNPASFPITIPPGGQRDITEICFDPKAEGQYSIDVAFTHDAPKTAREDSVSNWRGSSRAPGPFVIGNDWLRVRVNTTRTLPAKFGNNGNAISELNEIKFDTPPVNDEWKIVALPTLPRIFQPGGVDSLLLPIEFTPIQEFNRTNNIVGVFAPDVTLKGVIKGFGFLEKMQSNGFIFPDTVTISNANESRTSADDQQRVIIRNTSQSADLIIYDIQIKQAIDADNPHPSEFAFMPGTLPTFPHTIPIGGSLKLDMRFTPVNSFPQERKAQVVITHNAIPAIKNPEVGYRTDSLVTVIGYAKTVGGPSAIGFDLGDVLACNTPVGQINIAGATTNDVTLRGVRAISGDSNNFRVTSNTTNVLIPAGSNLSLNVVFTPDAIRSFATSYELDFVNSSGTVYTITVEVKGNSYSVPVSFSMNEERKVDLSLSNDVPMTIYAAPTNDASSWTQADIKNLRIVLSYVDGEIKYDAGSIRKGPNVPADWTVDAVETGPFNGRMRLTITGSGTTALPFVAGRSPLFEFNSKAFLSSGGKSIDLKTELDSAIVLQDASQTPKICVIETGIGTNTKPVGCFIDARFITFSNIQSQMMMVSPHPVTGNSINIDYQVSLPFATKIEVVNTLGDVVTTPVNTPSHKAGTHRLVVPTAQMSAGTYLIRMTCGAEVFTQQVVVTK